MSDLIIESYGISIEIPMHEPIAFEEIKATRATFIERKKQKINAAWHKNYDRATALINYAESCGGKLKRIINHQKIANLTFEFNDLDRMLHFAKNLRYTIDCIID